MKTVDNVITNAEVQQLLEYNSIIDDRTDARPDVVSKHPRWNIDQWPQHIIKRVLDSVLDYNYDVEQVMFNDSKISFRLHADSGKSDNDRKGENVLIPLYVDGPSHTVFFDNFWHQNSTKFSKRVILPFEYNLLNKNGQWQYVEDVRKLLDKSKTAPDTIEDFIVDENFIESLNVIIEARKNKKLAKVDNRCYDYTDIQNYNPSQSIDKNIRMQYLSHLEEETLKGLTIHTIAEWIPTSCIVFERTRLHCASSSHKRKIGITIFTRPKIK